MEGFAECGWWGPAGSKARTDLKDSLKILGGEAVIS